jgi:hypothetical protein
MGRDGRPWRLLGVVAAALALTTPALASAAQKPGSTKVNYDAVYTATNNPSGNSLVVFTRAANGTLTQRKVVRPAGRESRARRRSASQSPTARGQLTLRPTASCCSW